MLEWVERVVFTLVCAVALRRLLVFGIRTFLLDVVTAVRALPGVDYVIALYLRGEVKGFIRQINTEAKKGGDANKALVTIPETGVDPDELLQEMQVLKKKETNTGEGKVFAYVYTMENEHFENLRKAFDMFTESTGYEQDDTDSPRERVIREFAHTFLHENALNPMVFPALKQMETEVVAMVGDMLNGDANVAGMLTSGGTESILMAVKTYRDRARHLFPHITSPEMVAPVTIHPAFEKAAAYFNLTVRHAPLKDDFTVDLVVYKKLINPNTILLLGSAPQYCHGIVDPIPEMSAMAEEYGLPLHVDACFGGFMLPWVERLGHKVPVWDFRNAAVTSISADVHKYGFGVKGASVIVYRSAELRRFQIYAYSQWPGGLFGSVGFSGTRPGGYVAASWAALRSLGRQGYTEMAAHLMDTTKIMKDGVNQIEGLRIIGEPHMTAFAVGATDPGNVNILALADAMETKGWKIERQQLPDSLHCTILPHHIGHGQTFVDDLRASADMVRGNASMSKKGTAAMYGMVASVPDKTIVDDFVVQFFNQIYQLG